MSLVLDLPSDRQFLSSGLLILTGGFSVSCMLGCWLLARAALEGEKPKSQWFCVREAGSGQVIEHIASLVVKLLAWNRIGAGGIRTCDHKGDEDALQRRMRSEAVMVRGSERWVDLRVALRSVIFVVPDHAATELQMLADRHQHSSRCSVSDAVWSASQPVSITGPQQHSGTLKSSYICIAVSDHLC